MDTGTFLLTIPGQFLPALLQALGAEQSDYGVRGQDGDGAELWRLPASPKEQNIPLGAALPWGKNGII